MLNENLILELILNLNGKMLHNTPIFKNFDMQFLSELTFDLKRETYTQNDHIFDEGDEGSKLYFIIKGSVYLLHKQSSTFIKELHEEEYFGEITFFADDRVRTASARSKDFTEFLVLDRSDFINSGLTNPMALEVYCNLKQKLAVSKDLSPLGLKCYLCESLGHIASECDDFSMIQGNLMKHAIEKILQLESVIKS